LKECRLSRSAAADEGHSLSGGDGEIERTNDTLGGVEGVFDATQRKIGALGSQRTLVD